MYQRGPVCVQISDLQRWHKLGTGHHEEVEIKEELELLVENLRGQGCRQVSKYVSKTVAAKEDKG